MLEIERKWLLPTWPQKIKPIKTMNMEQSYLYVSDDIEVRLRKKEAITDEDPLYDPLDYYLDIKVGNGISRPEYSLHITEKQYEEIMKNIYQPPIKKRYHIYDFIGYKLEVSCVDDSWFYAEIEFDSLEEAEDFVCPFKSWKEVTDIPRYAMKNYWLQCQDVKGE